MPEVHRALGHVFYDCAASPYLYSPEVYAHACRIVGPGRILFGSDFPLIRPRRYLRDARAAGLPQEAIDAIFGENLQRLLHGGP